MSVLCLKFLCFILIMVVESRGMGDFVSRVQCESDGIVVRLRDRLPPPVRGDWSMSVDGYPDCPGTAKESIQGGHTFKLLYADKDWCGIHPVSPMVPAWVSYAETVLVLIDAANMTIADSISCVYDTRFDKSLLTFDGEIKSSNLIYGGSVAEEGTDVEGLVRGEDSISMHFLDEIHQPLTANHVPLGKPVVLAITVTDPKTVSQVLPENCYFSSSSVPEETGNMRTLPFIRKSCFNTANGLVRTMFSKMMRSFDGTQFLLPFPAFHFSDAGRSLYVHCTMHVCVANQDLCQPKSGCFSTDRRKRAVLHHGSMNNKRVKRQTSTDEEVTLTKFIVVDPITKGESSASSRPEGQFCISWMQLAAGAVGLSTIVIVILIAVLLHTCSRYRIHKSDDTGRMTVTSF